MISLVSSLYKSEKHLPYFLEKLKVFHDTLEKNGMGMESVIIANDISENEKILLQSYRDFDWVKIFTVPRETLYASWNRGIRESSGDVIGFWNVDDERYPEALVKAVTELSDDKQLAYFPFIYKRYLSIAGIDILVKKKVIDPLPFDRTTFAQGMHVGPFFMFKKELVKKIGLFDESFTIAGDFEWITRAVDMTDFVKINTIGGVFKNNGKTLSGKKSSIQKIENDKILKKILLLTK